MICLLKLLNKYWMPVRNAFPFPFFLSFSRCAVPNLFCMYVHTTIVWPMLMEAFDVMFSRNSVYVSRRLLAIEPMTALNLLLVCKLVHNAE